VDRPAPDPGGTPPEAPDRTVDDTGPSVVWTSVGVGVAGAGAALVVFGTAAGLQVLGVAAAAAGVSVLAAARSRPSGTGDDDPEAADEPGGGTAFAWSRFAPAMTLLTFVAAGTAAASLGLAIALVGLPLFGVPFAMIGALALAVALRFSPALRRRRVVVAPDGVTVELRGRSAHLPWATITAVDVGRPAPELAAMGGAITLRTLDHELPGADRLQRRLRALAAPYGPGADIALPVAGLRHDPGALLIALERGRPA
jgi:hypothetical protein